MNQESNAAQREMPRYIGHKLVWALQIRSIEPMDGNRHRLTFKDQGYGPITTEPGWVDRHQAQAGGYFVQYDTGYKSWSPQEPFERDYTPDGEWGVPVRQESKYLINAAGRLANRKTGIAIPDDEPVIVFRAKDCMLPAVLRHYRDLLPPGEHQNAIDRELQRVVAFQEAFATWVRVPD